MSKIKKIVLASGNKGKIKEFTHLFSEFNIEIIAQADLGIKDIEETGLSFVENSLLKARYAAQQSGLAALADDSGIEVFALKGQPGIYSARYAGEGASDTDNVEKLLQQLKGVDAMQRGARFYCALSLVKHGDDPTPLIAEGSWYGEVAMQPSGPNGFGYDPVFYLPDQQATAAQLEQSVKSQLSHRAQALNQLFARMNNQKLI